MPIVSLFHADSIQAPLERARQEFSKKIGGN
jgi:hypothetical protein